ncbi:MAG: glycosyltransferase family 2 protein [Thermoplasmata archaeon]|nr:glycosyltransferase family 2 protein [Thermoplasmata archaeon]
MDDASSDAAPTPGRVSDASPLRVSAVVVAHGRREFLADALRSLEDQTLPKDQFEVIVVKDFDSPELAPDFERVRAEVVDLDPGPLGAWIDRVRHRLRGELVAFLDDDDTFAPDKLARAVEVFRSMEHGLYYHHGTRPWPGPRPDRTAPGHDPTAPAAPLRAVSPPEWRRTFRTLWRAGAAFNLSSIVVRRALLARFPEQLVRIEVSLSAFLFYAALAAEGTVLLEDRPLTSYRREEGFRRDGAPNPRSALRLSALAGSRGTDARVLRELIAPLSQPELEAPLRAAIAQASILRALETHVGSKREVAGALWRIVRDRPWGALAAERVVFCDALLFLLSVDLGCRAWERHRGLVAPPAFRSHRPDR